MILFSCLLMKQCLLELLQEEKDMKLRGGLYHQTQIKLAYNSNRIEGSRLSEDQTRYIYETNTINTASEETADVDDIVETVNHFACFDYMLTHADEKLTEDMIKESHRFLKRGTSYERKEWFRVGDYKARASGAYINTKELGMRKINFTVACSDFLSNHNKWNSKGELHS